MEKKAWYRCDPQKNTQCTKRGCKYNPNSAFPECDGTSHIEYSTDCKPMKDEYPRSK